MKLSKRLPTLIGLSLTMLVTSLACQALGERIIFKAGYGFGDPGTALQRFDENGTLLQTIVEDDVLKRSLLADGNQVIVAEQDDQTVRLKRYSPTGEFVEDSFEFPTGSSLAVPYVENDAYGNILVSTQIVAGIGTIRRFAPDGTKTLEIEGLRDFGGSDAASDGTIYLASESKDGIDLIVFRGDGLFQNSYDFGLASVGDLTLDEENNRLFIALQPGGIAEIDLSGTPQLTTIIPTPPAGLIWSVTYDPVADHLFVSDVNTAWELETDGTIVRNYGFPPSPYLSAWDALAVYVPEPAQGGWLLILAILVAQRIGWMVGGAC